MRRRQLADRLDVVRRDRQRAKSAASQAELRAELHHLQQQLDEVDMALESRLLVEYGWNDLFWQTVRFVGLGVAIGWALKSCAG